VNSLFAQAALAILVLPGTIGFLIPLWWLAPAPLSVFSWARGGAFVVSGVAVLGWCVREFYVVGKGTLAPWAPPIRVVMTGPYRHSRNPMYVGVLLVLAGWAAGFQSWALAIYAAGVAVAFHLRVTMYEEPRLNRLDSNGWGRYRATVPRWFGRATRADR
jgi:protein-S-isoprenylcysteine O-methyltransferase Ste14